jgi:hypothetical protein
MPPFALTVALPHEPTSRQLAVLREIRDLRGFREQTDDGLSLPLYTALMLYELGAIRYGGPGLAGWHLSPLGRAMLATVGEN